ncbi:MAG: cyclodeaminase/cyclohydrolase family protein [Solirubrobacteraceae bacterium]
MSGVSQGPEGSAGSPFVDLLDRLGSADPIPGAGAGLAWSGAAAAALAEMVCAVTLRQWAPEPDAPQLADSGRAEVERRRGQAADLRSELLKLADRDAAAYQDVLAVLRSREEPDFGNRLGEALARAADPPLAIASATCAVAELAAVSLREARGGVRAEAVTAVELAECVTRGAVRLVEFNLAASPDDNRHNVARALVAQARAALRSATMEADQ